MKMAQKAGLLWIAGMMMSGCATTLTKPMHDPIPSKAQFRGFSAVEMKPVSLAPAYASYTANQKAMKKIDELLFASMAKTFPNLKRAESFSSGNSKVLQITPVIKEIKFIGGAARFWAGALAGSSAVLMQVNFIDGSTGGLLADPEFYEQANAWAGAWTIGGTDNMMLERVVLDIVSYTAANQ